MSIIEQIFSLMAPHSCLICGQENNLLCPGCAGLHLNAIASSCYRCSKLTDDFRTCPSCKSGSALNKVWIRTDYNQAAKQLIYELKFNHARAAAKTIAEELIQFMPNLNKNTIVVHVPAVTSHVRQRGFDQAALIASELAKLAGLRHINALARMGQTRQVGSSRAERIRQMQTVFRPLSAKMILDARFLIVDDVLTTGSTLEAAARTLRQAGAKTVDAIFCKGKIALFSKE